MYEKLKADMRAVGIAVSEGAELLVHEMQAARDFMYFHVGLPLETEFHRYEHALAAKLGLEAPEASTDDSGEPNDGSIGTETEPPAVTGQPEGTQPPDTPASNPEGEPNTGEVETKTYTDGTQATGTAPLPDQSPAQQEQAAAPAPEAQPEAAPQEQAPAPEGSAPESTDSTEEKSE